MMVFCSQSEASYLPKPGVLLMTTVWLTVFQSGCPPWSSCVFLPALKAQPPTPELSRRVSDHPLRRLCRHCLCHSHCPYFLSFFGSYLCPCLVASGSCRLLFTFLRAHPPHCPASEKYWINRSWMTEYINKCICFFPKWPALLWWGSKFSLRSCYVL
jgi:hypothetical protein